MVSPHSRLPHPLGHHCDVLMRILMLTMATAVAVAMAMAMAMGCSIPPRHRAPLWTALPARVESEIPTHRPLRTSPPRKLTCRICRIWPSPNITTPLASLCHRRERHIEQRRGGASYIMQHLLQRLNITRLIRVLPLPFVQYYTLLRAKIRRATAHLTRNYSSRPAKRRETRDVPITSRAKQSAPRDGGHRGSLHHLLEAR